MPFRPELDLTAILPSYYKNQRQIEEPEGLHDEDSEGYKYALPVITGASITEVWSTGSQVAKRIILKWDVNGYYKALGVHPDATRRELMQAYIAVNGQDSPWLTYCFKQLLNPEVRAAYDATPLGEPFLDEYTQAQIKQDAAREAMSRTKTGKAMTAEEVMDEWGYVYEPDEPLEMIHHTTSTQDFHYMFYAWKTSEYVPDQGRLADWQSILVSEAAKMGIIKEVAIGVTAVATKDILVQEDHQGRPIIYLNEQVAITEELAKDALVRAFAK